MKHLPLILSSLLLATAAHAQTDVRQLIVDRGCAACHGSETARSGATGDMPLAPAWGEIAARYKSVKGAQQQLTATVMTGTAPEGSDPTPYQRHWSGKVTGAYMPTHRYAISEMEAAQIVAWVLSLETVVNF